MGQIPSIENISFPAKNIRESKKRIKTFINSIKNTKTVTIQVADEKFSFDYIEGETKVSNLLHQFHHKLPQHTKVVAFKTDPAMDILDYMLCNPRQVLNHLTDGQLLKSIEKQEKDSSDLLSSFIPIKTLGKGGFSLVTLVRKKDSGQLFALKTVSKDHIIKTQRISHILSERVILSKLTHPFILSLKASFQTVTSK